MQTLYADKEYNNIISNISPGEDHCLQCYSELCTNVWRGAEQKMTVPSYGNRVKDVATEKQDPDPGVQQDFSICSQRYKDSSAPVMQ